MDVDIKFLLSTRIQKEQEIGKRKVGLRVSNEAKDVALVLDVIL